jgi:hypothetical protein
MAIALGSLSYECGEVAVHLVPFLLNFHSHPWPKRAGRFSRLMAQTTRTAPRVCVWGHIDKKFHYEVIHQISPLFLVANEPSVNFIKK